MTVRLALEGPVARLLLDRAPKRNAINQVMWEAIPPLVATAMVEPSVRVLVLTSATPGIFSAGADIEEFGARSADHAWRSVNRLAIRGAQLALARAEKPTVAAIDGDCVGGGCGLALACDLRVSTPASRLGITPARLGLAYPLHDVRLLVDLVGPGQAKRILFTGALFPAAEALRIGLVDLVADSAEPLVAEIASGAPYSQHTSKLSIAAVLAGQIDDDEPSVARFEAAFDGPDFAEGLAAFHERRPPRFG